MSPAYKNVRVNLQQKSFMRSTLEVSISTFYSGHTVTLYNFARKADMAGFVDMR